MGTFTDPPPDAESGPPADKEAQDDRRSSGRRDADGEPGGNRRPDRDPDRAGRPRAARSRPSRGSPLQPSLPPPVDLAPEEAIPLLEHGAVHVAGRLVQASNTTLLVGVTGDVPGRGSVTAAAVYKPVRGERPLWDFPDGTLAAREVAAHAVSAASGWDIVPPSVFRRDAPAGPGMLQLWVETRADVDILDLLRASDPRLRRIALFDAVVNNADRKGGHLLVRADGLIQGCDHGVTFNVEPRLRTVLWNWRGTKIAPRELSQLVALRQCLAPGGELDARLSALLQPEEVHLARQRLDALLATGLFPQPHPDWPAVPWPWY